MNNFYNGNMEQQVFDNKLFNDIIFKHGFPDGDKWKGAGVSVPVFSLRSKYSFGIGEFADLKYLADWCLKTGLKLIQILPINDTTTDNKWNDSYPYKTISIKALHPIYLNLSDMGELYDEEEKKRFEIIRKDLNAKEYVNYPEVMAVKNLFFKKIFNQTWNEVKNKADYINFFEENKDWLIPYAAFCYLRDKFKTADFSKWGKYKTYDENKIKILFANTKDKKNNIEIHYFLQYHLDRQLKDAVNYLHNKGIALKGDIPIGISPYSVEAWTEPQLFNLEVQSGAPPDSFSIKGQNWGFPTYNWDEMAKDNYKWWRNRLTHMSRYFDAYRIDHILGFFRIWEIPKTAVQGLLGYFNPAMPYSADDLRYNGIDFNEDRMTKPYIRSHLLQDIFGTCADEVRNKYLNEISSGYLELKPEFNTQRKITDYFTDTYPNPTEKEIRIREGLLELLSEVLFIKDPYTKDRYHPRIALQFTYSYRELPNYQKDAINHLYDDFFYRRNNDFWKHEALKKLSAIIKAGNMLVCGEDLGMVPPCTAEVMQQLRILSLEVQRMPKDPSQTFVNPAHNPYLSVDTTSTHDMSTLRGWWEENGTLSNRFYHEMLGHSEGAPFFAEPYVCQEIINQHLHSSSMWVVLPIQDYIAMDGELRWDQTQKEQINIPTNPDNHWCYRMYQSMEKLNEDSPFNEMLLEMITNSERK